ncbi:MAG: Beta-barrel assembly machine subunit BamD [Candidatus Electronema aureum]|uniref:Beta-barrel assembly machine subunit BamD n=1 Tax=Candidatus Electronema aureum TaxID=2005002 RepID=A0A521G062_9BACT|nr:MAG: Beta-barrel assembly machine subunit BamD [Candidatus Electronema aureum]
MQTAVSKYRTTQPRSVIYVLLAATCLSLSGCGTVKDMFSSWSFGADKDEAFEQADTLAAKGMEDYKIANYSDALKSFQSIIDHHPFSPQALLAELKAADCQYYSGKYAEAKELYKIFEERHPTNEAVPYVMFQIGMCDLSRSSRIDRDPTGARDAVQSFSQLLRVHPDSPYASEAKARIQEGKEFIASHEYFVAVFYVRTSKYEQAQHRLKYLIATHPDAAVIPKAKELLTKLEAGKPPKWGIEKWLPDWQLPDWGWWKKGKDVVEETGKEAEKSAQ